MYFIQVFRFSFPKHFFFQFTILKPTLEFVEVSTIETKVQIEFYYLPTCLAYNGYYPTKNKGLTSGGWPVLNSKPSLQQQHENNSHMLLGPFSLWEETTTMQGSKRLE